jgi:hypothetical protein
MRATGAHTQKAWRGTNENLSEEAIESKTRVDERPARGQQHGRKGSKTWGPLRRSLPGRVRSMGQVVSHSTVHQEKGREQVKTQGSMG